MWVCEAKFKKIYNKKSFKKISNDRKLTKRRRKENPGGESSKEMKRLKILKNEERNTRKH